METDQRAPDQGGAPSTEDQQKFFQGLAQVASNFLQPLGLRVNLEHLADQQQQSGSSEEAEVHARTVSLPNNILSIPCRERPQLLLLPRRPYPHTGRRLSSSSSPWASKMKEVG